MFVVNGVFWAVRVDTVIVKYVWKLDSATAAARATPGRDQGAAISSAEESADAAGK